MNTRLFGAGLGLRRALLGPIATLDAGAFDFLEVAPENWIEIAYQDLCGHEAEDIERIYSQFGYTGWDRAKPALSKYVSGLEGYKRNKLKLDAKTRDEVYEWWKPVFDAYDYPREYIV